MNTTFLEIREEDDGSWSVLSEHGLRVAWNLTSRANAARMRRVILKEWDEQRKEDGA